MEMAIRRRLARVTGVAPLPEDNEENGQLVEDDTAEKKKTEITKDLTAGKENVIPNQGAHCHNSFLVAKWAILRLIGLVYAFAFLGAYFQNRGLMGSGGLSPADAYMASLRSRFPDNGRGRIDGFLSHPTLFWWLDLTDDILDIVALAGLGLSALVTLGLNSWFVMALLWILDFSIVTVA
eukprot:CAMPEP_0113587252 /NCGR_PEP_ID=MMETSP0015_2-20120614/34789_1 /TAXON_ID=2838 /ORGANISM="Odontella" /LENGTH=179 /DNA_ID=CAMNT_0000492859 /DNA_START=417 /DNA_END=953 /DNA_ORIENTATION=- /assembly_acc=CAM_ASM_000160